MNLMSLLNHEASFHFVVQSALSALSGMCSYSDIRERPIIKMNNENKEDIGEEENNIKNKFSLVNIASRYIRAV